MREATGSWKTLISDIVNVQEMRVADIGCGGGTYSRALLDMGAAHVTCIDFSQAMLEASQARLGTRPNIAYVQASARQTTLPDQQFHIILERAVIHHLEREELVACFTEAYRLLRQGGRLIIQDRTAEDCQQPGSSTHIRGYFFDRYPKLLAYEVQRRHSFAVVMDALSAAGFRAAEKRQLWETRHLHGNFAALAHDLQERRGRSILHELTDEELEDLIQYIQYRLDEDVQPIVEQDRWTIWSAMR
ncbi:MAG TPA: methyltransferase domain-containing protein [Dictyobacter sp.]|nr:methyltransferase domain-containing protein [Dictyobacter sp.]